MVGLWLFTCLESPTAPKACVGLTGPSFVGLADMIAVLRGMDARAACIFLFADVV